MIRKYGKDAPTGMADFFDVKKFPAALALQMGVSS
jgi:putative spermidine/putrescine transport system substrate-binding protein